MSGSLCEVFETAVDNLSSSVSHSSMDAVLETLVSFEASLAMTMPSLWRAVYSKDLETADNPSLDYNMVRCCFRMRKGDMNKVNKVLLLS